MAIDSRIALAGKPLNIGQRVAQNVQNLQQVDLLNQRREQAPFQNQLLQLQTELAQAQQPANLQQAEFAASGLTQQLQTQQQIQQFDLGNAKSLSNALASNDLNMIDNELARQEQVVSELVRNGQLDESELLEVQQARQIARQPNGIESLSNITNRALGVKPIQGDSFTLKQGETRFGPDGKVVASVAPKQESKPVKPISPVLLGGLSESVALKGASAYEIAGGGTNGLAAFTKVVDKATEQERRISSPKLISESFPQASAAEMKQLMAAMDGAKTTNEGLKAAGKVRSEQRKTKKAKVFQTQAVELINKILSSDELGDVLGSVEGAFDFRLQDSEAELIVDIEEARDILTSDNMDLMSGVLSESDIKLLKNLSGGALNRKRSEDQFRERLSTLRDRLSSVEVLTVDEIGQTDTSRDLSKLSLEELKSLRQQGRN